MIVKNGLVWNGRSFEKKDLFIQNGQFVNANNYTEAGPVVDATGLFVLPGFVDSHAHIIGTGMKILTHDMSKEKIEDILSPNVKENFIIARGWEELPENYYLQLANIIQKPIILVRKCGHVAWINNYLKSKLNYKENLIYESAIDQVWKYFGDEFYENAFRIGQKEFLKYGVTQVHSDDFHGISFESLKKLLEKSQIRVFEKLCTNEPWKYEFGEFGMSKIKGIKIYADGSLGARTAYMFQPYVDTNDFGLFTVPENFDEIINYAEKNNLQLNIHTIGDKALNKIIMILEKHNVKQKHRLIHLQFVKMDDFGKLKNFYLSVQPHFYYEDLGILIYVRYELAYPFLKMYQSGYDIAFSTDSPVSPVDPRYVLESALKMGFSKPDAIKLYTESGARMADIKAGKIEEGYLADFCLYEGDPFTNLPVSVFIGGKEIKEE
ncbi:amidohydrolase family protein [Fervidobacterium sp. 2310opik-2]|uniref:amidohydrolase n=1 Tax=Fervidobacterium sp. 2310opik-2 TaxID=1755815 RepID=UPI0013E0D5D6|nr:amidohydrolase family protein [Fervidobacterium sp. 2310opik-2]KAF2961951.1 amidohydrolase [Fervidobacterium sp. 2310opik-2]